MAILGKTLKKVSMVNGTKVTVTFDMAKLESLFDEKYDLKEDLIGLFDMIVDGDPEILHDVFDSTLEKSVVVPFNKYCKIIQDITDNEPYIHVQLA